MVVVGGLTLAASVAVSPDLPSLVSDPATLATLFGITVVSILLPVSISHRGEAHGFNLSLAVAAGVLMVAADVLVVPFVAAAALTGSALTTRSVTKTLFNAAQDVVSVAALVLVARAVSDGEVAGDVLRAGPASALVLGVGAALVVNSLIMTELFHRLSGSSRRAVLDRTIGPLTILSAFGDTVVALLIVVLVDRSPIALLLATPLLVGLHLGYRGLETSRYSARRTRMLHQTSRALLAGAVDDDCLVEAVRGLRALFQADTATLRVVGLPPDDIDADLDRAMSEVTWSGQPVLDTTGGGIVAVPVVLDGRILGSLAVAGRHGMDQWGEADVSLLSTVAGEVASALRARRLYESVEHERASLALESQRLGDILHGASDGILLLDDLGRIESCNPAMGDILGGLPEDVIGRRWDDVLRLEEEDGRPIHVADGSEVSRALAGLTGTVAEVRLRQVDGGWRWLRCSVAPVSRDGELAGVVLVAIDLTNAREVDELRSDFLATVSHELRTPLTPLKGFMAVLGAHGDQLPEDRTETIHAAMNKQLGRLEDLIGDLLLVAELDGGSPRVHIEPLALQRVVEDVLDTEVSSADARDRLTVSVPDVTVLGDGPGLRRVLRSLVSNGLKHTGGEVRVTADVVGREAVIVVCDEGPGIPDADREVVFQPFRRLGNPLHRTQGPGLGLAIARSLAEAIGGSLELAPAGDGGACFVLRVPHDAVPAANGRRRAALARSGERAR